MLQQKEKNRFRFIVDGKEVPIAEDLMIKDEQGNNYINLKMLASYTGYKYTKGDLIEVNEDINSCYIENNYEEISFKADKNTFVKYIKNEGEIPTVEGKPVYKVKSKNKEKEIFKTELPIKLINEQIYIPLNIGNIATNSIISLTDKNLSINSLDYMVQAASTIAPKYGYSKIDSTFENVRAIPKGMLVVNDGSKCGVININNGNIILGIRYDELKYMQNENKFYIYVDNKVGLIGVDGKTIISPKEYDSIETFDVDKNLYLVKQDGKYGLLTLEGKSILHTDYEQIGINNIEDYKLKEIENENLWFDSIIAIKRGSLYGLYNVKDKEEILEINYNDFGYKAKSTDTIGEESVLLIPKETGVEGIVLFLDGRYGIFDINKKELIIPCACDRIYSISNNGIKTYYMEYNGLQIEMREYFESHDLISVEVDETEDTTE